MVALGEKYLEQAYLCALSIKATQTDINNVSVITNVKTTEKQELVFDNVIFKDIEDESRYSTKLRSQVYNLTPYEETIVLDTDMLFTSDVSDWWNKLERHDIFFTTQIKTYRDEVTDNRYYRELFNKFDMLNTYVAVHYFKKTELAGIFYSLVKFISSDEKKYYKQILETEKDIDPSFDFTCSLVIKMLELENLVTLKNSPYPTFVHLKGQNQNWIDGTSNWLSKVPYYIDEDLNVFVGNYKQSGILHYTETDFVTKSIISLYEEKI